MLEARMRFIRMVVRDQWNARLDTPATAHGRPVYSLQSRMVAIREEVR